MHMKGNIIAVQISHFRIQLAFFCFIFLFWRQNQISVHCRGSGKTSASLREELGVVKVAHHSSQAHETAALLRQRGLRKVAQQRSLQRGEVVQQPAESLVVISQRRGVASLARLLQLRLPQLVNHLQRSFEKRSCYRLLVG